MFATEWLLLEYAKGLVRKNPSHRQDVEDSRLASEATRTNQSFRQTCQRLGDLVAMWFFCAHNTKNSPLGRANDWVIKIIFSHT
jgi:hypothetical protein